ncbi:hypothetical protein ACIPRD_13905 [Streptomyces sp. NPDC090108]|uniref:hypothetical protein n=1 Tax=Streptomyces sp. NPDC090108 TaxID=3365947 RepID=UPI0037F2770C
MAGTSPISVDGRVIEAQGGMKCGWNDAARERVLEAATAWVRAEDGNGMDPALIADFLQRLGELARDAGQRRRLYCGMSL